jgi:hypothetical protein
MKIYDYEQFICGAPYKTKIMLRTTNAAGRIRDESLMNLGGRGYNLPSVESR